MPLDLERLGSDFRHRHREIYGYATEEHWEMQSLRLRARSRAAPRSARSQRPKAMPEPTSIAPCWFEPSAPHDTPRYGRDLLPSEP